MPEKKRQVKLVPMYVEDINRLYEVADSIGIPFRKVLSDIASEGGKLYLASKGDLKSLGEVYMAIHNLRSLGFFMLPVEIVNNLLNENSGKASKLYAEAERIGEAIGNIYAINNYLGISDIKGVVKLLFLDATQVTVNEKDGELRIAVNVPGRRRELIELSLRFLDSFLKVIGYNKTSGKVSNSLVILTYRRSE